MSTIEIANRLVELCRQNQFEQAQKELYANDATSTEPEGSPGMQSVQGLDKIIEKGRQFQAMVEELHSSEVDDPLIAGNYFSVSSIMDVTLQGLGRTKMEEIAVYRVKNDKIVSEEFFYDM